MTARHHHFLSQCYLKGFTKGQNKKSNLIAIDLKEKRKFETKPRNVGGMRDFNRINIKGVDQNFLENELSKFEGQVATALKQLKDDFDFSDKKRELILNLIAMIAVRSPERREHMKKFEGQIIERMMAMTLESEEIWENQNLQMKENNPDFQNKTTYEEAKKFFESKKYIIDIAREHHIQMEMDQIDIILPLLSERKWRLITSNENTGPFITTDRPMNLSWKEPDSVPAIYRSSPGFGLRNTEVYFPISQELALFGDFDGKNEVIKAPEKLVASLNTRMLTNYYKQIYTPKIDFKFISKDLNILSGKFLFRDMDN